MANWSVMRPGQVNQAGDANALFLKLFSGEVLTTYQTECIMDPLVRKRSISGGKSAQFPVTGRVTGKYHTPGVELVGQATNQNEIVIPVDDLLVADVSFYNLDEAKSQYDFRSIYSTEAGRALAREKDKKLIRTGLLAARTASAPVTEQFGGSALTDAAMATDKTILRKNIKAATQKFDEKDIPTEGRHAILRPAQYYLLLEDDLVVNGFYDTKGSIAHGSVRELYNISIHKSNNIPSGVVASAAGENNTYNGDFTKTVALIFQQEAIGTVNLLDLATEMEYTVSRQSWLLVSKYACGHGILRAACAVELATP